MSLFTFTGKKLVLLSCPSEEGLTFVCFLFLVGITSAWFSFLEEIYHQLMSSGFMTWCEKGKGQRWALPWSQSGSGPPGRSSSFLPAECLQLHGSPGGLPRTQSLIHRRVTLAQLGTPSLLQPPPLLSTLHTHLLCSWLQNFKKPVHRETRKSRELTGPKEACPRVTVLRGLLSSCHLWRLHACSSEQNSPLFLFKGFCEVRFFPNNFIRSRVWCQPIKIEISASLSWISNLPKSGMFSPGKWLLTYFPFVLDPTQPSENTSN